MATIVPSESITYVTKLTGNEVIEKLYSSPNYETFGEGFRDNRFHVKRVITYRNSFLPYIRGVVSENGEKTMVTISMKPQKFATVFMVIWLVGVLASGILSLALMVREFDIFQLIPFIMFFAGILIFYGGFKFESKKSKKELQEIFEAEIAR